MKTCIKCGATKTRTEFHNHPGAADGRIRTCKACVRDYALARYRRLMEADHQFAARQAEAARKRRTKTPLTGEAARKARIRASTRYALKCGRIKKPDRCCLCGSNDKLLEMHHVDYDQPLTVTFMCRPCHGKSHRREIAALP